MAVTASVQAQFVAYFDHSRGTNPAVMSTHSNTLSFFVNTTNHSGYFTNVSDGVTTPVFLIAATNGALTTGGASAEPAAGTPAYTTFNGFVTFGSTPSSALQVPLNVTVTYTFSNLNPNARYSFKGSVVRGNTAYTNRWTKVTISGADSATPNHTANVLTSAQAPADLGPNDAAFNSGLNHQASQGDMVVWEDISPGTDGIFQIISTRYAGFVPNGGSSTAGSPPYGYAISGIRLEEIIGNPVPVAITAGPNPSSLTITQGQTAQFQVTVTGTAPRYQWYREDGQPIQHAVSTNGPILEITNAQPTDTAVYRVKVTNSVNSVTSGPASLTVDPDNTPPTLVSALGLVDGTNVLISFSEPLDTSVTPNGAAFHVQLTAGGGALTVVRVAFTNGTNVLISTDTARTANANYSLSIDPNTIADANGNYFVGTQTPVPLPVEVRLMAFDGTSWKYENSGNNLGTDWRLDENFDDSGWSNGISVLDVKNTGRTTIAGFTVRTFLVLTNELYPVDDIPTMYFRGHFNLATDPSEVARLQLRTLVDDADVLYLNHGSEIHRSTRYTNVMDLFEYCSGNIGNATIEGPYTLPTTDLVAGDNLVASSLHQNGATSSDLTFAYELTAIVNRFIIKPKLTITYDGAQVHITWANPADQLYSATTVDAAAGAWLPGATGGSTNLVPSGGLRFFTIRR